LNYPFLTSYERDSETQLDYAKARYFTSIQGRFTSPDPLLASGRPAVPESWNRYTYVLNNPLALVDPDGLDWGVTEWTDDKGVRHTNYHYFNGEIGEYKGRTYTPVNFGSATYKDINADDGTVVRISNVGILRQVIYAGPSGYGSRVGQENLNLSAGLVDGTLPYGRQLREFAFGEMGVDTSAPEYENGAAISEGVSIGVTVLVGGVRIPGCLVETAVPTRIYSARVLLRSANEAGPFHNFPESFNAEVFRGSRTVTSNFFKVDRQGLSNDSIMYRTPGSINGVSGTFEIGVRPSVSGRNEVIMHRFFRPNPPK
jgi:RHS repeat-associated protein